MDTAHRRPPRLFLEASLSGDSLRLSDREAHYVGHVLRLKRGDAVLLFNGLGQERHARIQVLSRRHAELGFLESAQPLPEPGLELVLIQAVVKSEPMDWVVQKATELGVRTILPAFTDYSVVRLDSERAARRLEHWRKVARAACEQSGRHRPPIIEPPAPLGSCLQALPSSFTKLASVPGAGASFESLSGEPQGVGLLIGPEGGFSERDTVQIDAAGFQRVSLGPRVLRAETAALVGCALVQARWGDLS